MPAVEIDNLEQYSKALAVLTEVGGTFHGVGGDEKRSLLVTLAQYRALVAAGVIKDNGAKDRSQSFLPMSDFLLVRGIDARAARPLFDAWKAGRKWVRSVELRDAWEPNQLEINGRDAVWYMQGKHKDDLADLIILIQEHGGRVVHLMLHRSTEERREEDLGEWASRRTRHGT